MVSLREQQKAQTRQLLAVFALFVLVFLPQITFARGGGGGSGGGGGGGGGSHGGGGGGSSGAPNWFAVIVMITVMMISGLVLAYIAKKRVERAKKVIAAAAAKDSVWVETELTNHVRDVFLKFQSDWSSFNVDSMKTYLTDSYWRRMVLELNILKNEHRQNLMKGVRLSGVTILEAVDVSDNAKDFFTVQVDARAYDALIDTESNEELYADQSSFTEYWDFVREGNEWKLNLIKQETEDVSMKEPAIIKFAEKNNFFYDPDFGWLMMPNKGVIFSKSNFKTSDINNHVVGYYRDKVVEFYTFLPMGQTGGYANYVVAQIALPIKYKDILVRRKRALFNFSPSGLRRIKTESNDFDRKFCLWAHPEDQVRSFELLTPNFMEKVYELPFELNIEVVGSFLYFYAKDRKDVDYDKMLEILSWAFDEMKM